MSKFTPGPWKFCGLNSVFSCAGEPIAFVGAEHRIDSNGHIAPSANAALIAAAPAMYEALRKAIEWIEDDRVDDEYINEQWYHEAKAALRAAERSKSCDSSFMQNRGRTQTTKS